MFPNLTKTLKTIVPFLFSSDNACRTVSSIFSSFVKAAIGIGGPLVLVKSLDLESTGGEFKEKSTTQGLIFLGLYGTSFALMQALPKLQNMLTSPINTQLSSSISQKIVTKYFQLPFDHTLSTPVGQVGQLIGSIFISVDKLIPALLNNMFPSFVESIAAISILSVEVTDLTAPILGGFLFLYVISAIYGAIITRETEKERVTKGIELYGEIIKILLNYENVHYFGNENFELNRFFDVISQYRAISNRSQRKIECSSLLQSAIIGANFITLIVYSGYEVYKENAELTDFFLINLYAIQFSISIGKLADAIYDIHSASSDFEEILNFLAIESPIKDMPGANEIKLADGQPPAVEFKNVFFSYKKEKKSEEGVLEEKSELALDNVSFKAEAGKITAIVGLTGAGKTTLLRLLFRFYDLQRKVPIVEMGTQIDERDQAPDAKEEKSIITVNEQDIRTVTLSSLRALFSVVPQNPVIMHDSIKNNIKYGNFAAGDQAIDAAIEKSGLLEVVNTLPAKANTIVGEHGLTLSGGQRQQIAIGRAILKNGPIVLLDEATASLDSVTEKALQARLDAELKGKTVIMITHRLNQAVTKADKIVVLDKGKIAEQGSFSALMARNGVFKQQMQAYQGDTKNKEEKKGKGVFKNKSSGSWMAADRSEQEETLIARLSMLYEARADILRKFGQFGHTSALDREFERFCLEITEIENELKGEKDKPKDVVSSRAGASLVTSFSNVGGSRERTGSQSRSFSPPSAGVGRGKKKFGKTGSNPDLTTALTSSSSSSSSLNYSSIS